jgi:hypothetical protein
MAADIADHWSPTDKNGTRGSKTLNSARLVALDSSRLDSAVVYAFPRSTIISEPCSLCRVFMSQIGLVSKNLLVGTYLEND